MSVGPLVTMTQYTSVDPLVSMSVDPLVSATLCVYVSRSTDQHRSMSAYP
jgi:hypothetical protein